MEAHVRVMIPAVVRLVLQDVIVKLTSMNVKRRNPAIRRVSTQWAHIIANVGMASHCWPISRVVRKMVSIVSTLYLATNVFEYFFFFFWITLDVHKDDAFEARDLENEIEPQEDITARLQKIEKQLANEKVQSNELQKTLQSTYSMVDSLKNRLINLVRQKCKTGLIS